MSDPITSINYQGGSLPLLGGLEPLTLRLRVQCSRFKMKATHYTEYFIYQNLPS